MLKITDCCLHSHAAPLPGHVSARAGPGPGDHAADPGRVLGHADKHVREARLGAAGAEGGHTHQVPAAVLILVSNMIIYVHISISTGWTKKSVFSKKENRPWWGFFEKKIHDQ